MNCQSEYRAVRIRVGGRSNLDLHLSLSLSLSLSGSGTGEDPSWICTCLCLCLCHCQDQGRGKIQAVFAIAFENSFSFEFGKGGKKELIFKQRLKISFYANKKLAFPPANKLSIRLCLIPISKGSYLDVFFAEKLGFVLFPLDDFASVAVTQNTAGMVLAISPARNLRFE